MNVSASSHFHDVPKQLDAAVVAERLGIKLMSD